MKLKIMVSIILPILALSGCTAYKSQYVSFRPPDAYPNYSVVDGVSLGAEAFADPEKAQNAFGFDIRGAGLLPVQVVIDNRSGLNLEIMLAETFLVDDTNGYWNVVPNNTAISRLENSTQLAAIGEGAVKGGLLGATGGAIVGTAVGLASGRNVGTAIGTGAAIGGAGGAVIGGAHGGTSSERVRTIINDVRTKGLEGKVIPTEALTNGFLFFPSEAPSAKELRLQYLERESGMVQTVILNLK
jgi:hypothetical protein